VRAVSYLLATDGPRWRDSWRDEGELVREVLR